LCREYQSRGLIITLHRGNATTEKLPVMADWMRRLHDIGIKSVRLHLLEVDHDSVRASLALFPRENVQALLAFAEIQEMHFDWFEEMEALLNGQDARCTENDPLPYSPKLSKTISASAPVPV
jgi:uncharacterized protein